MALLGVETIVTLDKFIEASKLNCPSEYPDQLEKTRSQFVVELGAFHPAPVSNHMEMDSVLST